MGGGSIYRIFQRFGRGWVNRTRGFYLTRGGLLRPFLLEEAECRHMKFWQTGNVELTGRLTRQTSECRLN